MSESGAKGLVEGLEFDDRARVAEATGREFDGVGEEGAQDLAQEEFVGDDGGWREVVEVVNELMWECFGRSESLVC